MSRGLVRAFGQDFRFGARVGERKNEMLSKFKGEQRSRAEGAGGGQKIDERVRGRARQAESWS